MMNKEEYTIRFADQTGFRISECDITTGKVVVNGIEITSVEDWEKVTKSLVDLQQRIDKAIEYIKKYASYIDYLSIDRHKEIGHLDMQNVKELLEILGGKE